MQKVGGNKSVEEQVYIDVQTTRSKRLTGKGQSRTNGTSRQRCAGAGELPRTTNERRSERNPRSTFRHLRSQSPLARTSQTRNAHQAGRKTLPDSGIIARARWPRRHPQSTSRETLAGHSRQLRAQPKHGCEQAARIA